MKRYIVYDGVMQALLIIVIPEFIFSAVLYDVHPFFVTVGSFVEGGIAAWVFHKMLSKTNTVRDGVLLLVLGIVLTIMIVGMYVVLLIRVPVCILPRRDDLGVGDILLMLVCVKQFIFVNYIARMVICSRWIVRKQNH